MTERRKKRSTTARRAISKKRRTSSRIVTVEVSSSPSIAEAAARLGVSIPTIRRRIRSGELRARRDRRGHLHVDGRQLPRKKRRIIGKKRLGKKRLGKKRPGKKTVSTLPSTGRPAPGKKRPTKTNAQRPEKKRGVEGARPDEQRPKLKRSKKKLAANKRAAKKRPAKKRPAKKKRRPGKRYPSPTPSPPSIEPRVHPEDERGFMAIARGLGIAPRFLLERIAVGRYRGVLDELGFVQLRPLAVKVKYGYDEPPKAHPKLPPRAPVPTIPGPFGPMPAPRPEPSAAAPMDIYTAAAKVGHAMRDYVMARTVEDRIGTLSDYKGLKVAFRQTYGNRRWRAFFEWIVDEWGLEDYVFDRETLRDS